MTELEKSFVTPKSEKYAQLDEARQFLSVTYSSDLLVDLSSTVKEALQGPLGDYYIESRLDMLCEVSSLLWQTYLLPVLQKIDTYIEMRAQKEYNVDFVDTIDEAVIRVKHEFVDSLDVIHRILSRIDYV